MHITALTGHFGNESFQAITCTVNTDDKNALQNNQTNQHHKKA